MGGGMEVLAFIGFMWVITTIIKKSFSIINILVL